MAARIVWFRRDLRLADNAALSAAVASGDEVVAVALARGAYADADASDAWRRLSLASLARSLEERGGTLAVCDGRAESVVCDAAVNVGARVAHCTRDWTPGGRREEVAVRDALGAHGITLQVSEGQLLVPPDALATASGDPYRVFTPYFRRWLDALELPSPLPAPARVPGPRAVAAPAAAGTTPPPHGDVPPAPPVADPIDVAAWWRVGEDAARERLAEFVAESLADYDALRDRPALRGTSELSPRLASGELSPAQVLATLPYLDGEEARPFVRQLAWREFAYHVLHHFPECETRPLRPEFEAFPWRDDPAAFEAWLTGSTGYALVDAGMRQLSATGWMHNRARLVCGSFLTKDLLIPWQSGEAHFRRLLVDYDPALNAFNWQWVAGSGADAAPYFRIFNPEIQRTRFDADGAYSRRWLGSTAEPPDGRIVDHALARERALAAYAAIKPAAQR